MEEQKKNKTGVLLVVLLILLAIFVLYFQMWMPKPAKQQLIRTKDSIVSMITGQKAATKVAETKPGKDDKNKPADDKKDKTSKEIAKGENGGKTETEKEGSKTLAGGGSVTATPETGKVAIEETKQVESEETETAKPLTPDTDKTPVVESSKPPVPDETASSKPSEQEVNTEDAEIGKTASDKEKPESAVSAEQGVKTAKQAPWTASYIVEMSVKHFEMAPEAFFKTAPYYDSEKGMASYLLAVKSAAKTAAMKAATEEDKAYAGTAYFTSIEDYEKAFNLENPFEPLIKEDISPKGRTGLGQAMEDVPDDGSPSYSWGGGGRIGSSDIWTDFTTPRIPNDGDISNNGGRIPDGDSSNGGFSLPVTYPEGTFLLNGSPVLVKGIARSTEGCSALLQVQASEGEKIIRVQLGTVLEGRYKVEDIDDNLVLITDTVSGKTYRLKMGVIPVPILATDSARPAGNSPVLITDGRG